MHLAVDVMGGDQNADEIVRASLRCAHDFPDLQLSLVGDPLVIGPDVAGSVKMRVVATSQVVEMADRPGEALRHKRDSSMHGAIKLLAEGEVDGVVSAGNTGALMAIGRFLLRTLPGIDRPAIIKEIPSRKGGCYLLDLGANINCDADNLVQFAIMGSLMCRAVGSKPTPRVGLLNIGEEDSKGEEQVRIAADLLRLHPQINFMGFVEGDGIYQSDADVIVCDGLVGNVALKTSEGLASFVAQMIEDALDASNVEEGEANQVLPQMLGRLRRDLMPERYNGATLVGLTGIVVKSHGRAREQGFYQALRVAMHEVEQDVPNRMRGELASMLGT